MRSLTLAALAAVTCLLIACGGSEDDPAAGAPLVLREAIAEETRLLALALSDTTGQYAGGLAEWTRGMVAPGCTADDVHSGLFLFQIGYLGGLIGDAEAVVDAAIDMQGADAALVTLTVRAEGAVVETAADNARDPRERWERIDGRWRKACPSA